MKVVEGKFGNKEEDMTLLNKLHLTIASLLTGEEDGNFVILLDVGGDEVFISSDMITPDIIHMMESCKLTLLLGNGVDLSQPSKH